MPDLQPEPLTLDQAYANFKADVRDPDPAHDYLRHDFWEIKQNAQKTGAALDKTTIMRGLVEKHPEWKQQFTITDMAAPPTPREEVERKPTTLPPATLGTAYKRGSAEGAAALSRFGANVAGLTAAGVEAIGAKKVGEVLRGGETRLRGVQRQMEATAAAEPPAVGFAQMLAESAPRAVGTVLPYLVRATPAGMAMTGAIGAADQGPVKMAAEAAKNYAFGRLMPPVETAGEKVLGLAKVPAALARPATVGATVGGLAAATGASPVQALVEGLTYGGISAAAQGSRSRRAPAARPAVPTRAGTAERAGGQPPAPVAEPPAARAAAPEDLAALPAEQVAQLRDQAATAVVQAKARITTLETNLTKAREQEAKLAQGMFDLEHAPTAPSQKKIDWAKAQHSNQVKQVAKLESSLGQHQQEIVDLAQRFAVLHAQATKVSAPPETRAEAAAEPPEPVSAGPVRMVPAHPAAESAVVLARGEKPAAAPPAPEPAVPAPEPVQAPAEAAAPIHDYSTTQVNLPAGALPRFRPITEKISPADLAEEGIETQPHVTVKFGLHNEDPAQVQELLSGEGPIRFKIGKLSIFEPSETGGPEVLKADVESPDLARLNAKLEGSLPNTKTYKEYQPHLTIAYLKPGTGAKYLRTPNPLEGQEFTVNEVNFTDRQGNPTPVKLTGARPEAAETAGAVPETKGPEAETKEPVLEPTEGRDVLTGAGFTQRQRSGNPYYQEWAKPAADGSLQVEFDRGTGEWTATQFFSKGGKRKMASGHDVPSLRQFMGETAATVPPVTPESLVSRAGRVGSVTMAPFRLGAPPPEPMPAETRAEIQEHLAALTPEQIQAAVQTAVAEVWGKLGLPSPAQAGAGAGTPASAEPPAPRPSTGEPPEPSEVRIPMPPPRPKPSSGAGTAAPYDFRQEGDITFVARPGEEPLGYYAKVPKRQLFEVNIGNERRLVRTVVGAKAKAVELAGKVPAGAAVVGPKPSSGRKPMPPKQALASPAPPAARTVALPTESPTPRRPTAATAPVVAARQPWQMTKEEFVDREQWEYGDRQPAPEFAARDHRYEVKTAIAAGKPVPPEVLADYPDLKPPTEPPSTPLARIAELAKKHGLPDEGPMTLARGLMGPEEMQRRAAKYHADAAEEGAAPEVRDHARRLAAFYDELSGAAFTEPPAPAKQAVPPPPKSLQAGEAYTVKKGNPDLNLLTGEEVIYLGKEGKDLRFRGEGGSLIKIQASEAEVLPFMSAARTLEGKQGLPFVEGAKVRLKARMGELARSEKGEFSTDLNTQDIKDLYAVGKEVLTRTGSNLEEWQRAMRKTIGGNPSGATLTPIWDAIQPGPMWYSQLERTIESKMPNAAPVEQVRAIVSGPTSAVKADELKWSGLQDWLASKTGKVTKQEVMDFVRQNNVRTVEVQKGLTQGKEGGVYEESGGSPKFGTHALPGGKNYGELLMLWENPPTTMVTEYKVWTPGVGKQIWQGTKAELEDFLRESPGSTVSETTSPAESQPGWFTGSHWDEPNVLAHVRFNDRVDATGKKVLFLEEVQSDWHEKGRERGYETPPAGSEKKNAIPGAPFAKSWHELVMKRMLRWAAERGYDKMAWTTGEQQAERYNQLLRGNELKYTKLPNGAYLLELREEGTRTWRAVPGQTEEGDLPGVAGKNVAQRIVDGGRESGTIKGENLQIGGPGMKGFYDKMLPDFMNKYGKRWGAKVGETEIRVGPKLGSEIWDYAGPTATPQTFEAWLKRRQAKWESRTSEGWWGSWNVTRNRQAQEVLKALKTGRDFKSAMQQHGSSDLATQFGGELVMSRPTKGEKVHSIDVTPEMKKSVLFEGQPISRAEPPPALRSTEPPESRTRTALA